MFGDRPGTNPSPLKDAADKWLMAAAILLFAFTGWNAAGASWCRDRYTNDKGAEYTSIGTCAADGWRFVFPEIESFAHDHREIIELVSTGIVALFTIVLALVSRRQVDLTKKVAEETAIAATAARDSADALPKLERSYLFVEIDPISAVGVKSLVKRDGNLLIRYRYINHGKTPAIITGASATLANASDVPDEIDCFTLSSEIVVPGGEIYPPIEKYIYAGGRGAQQTVIDAYKYVAHLDPKLSEDDLVSIQDGNSSLWFYGRIIYDDIFTKAHETAFCWRFDPTQDQFVIHGNAHNFRT
jgi:hypothetical protein